MQRIKRIIIHCLLMGIGFCLLIILITSTTKFQIKTNPMQHFFSQHEPIDSTRINEKIPEELYLQDIEYLINTIEKVHPNPYHAITKDEFYYLADSIKQSLMGEIGRKELFNVLSSLINSIHDGHTNIHFPEISKGQDNQSNFKNEHVETEKLVNYNTINDSIGYLVVVDFTMDKNAFKNRLDQVFKQIKKESISYLIIDVRNNPGGNSDLSDILISYIYNQPYKANSKILFKRSEQYYSYFKGYFAWWLRPFLRLFNQVGDYYNTPIGDIYVEVKADKYISDNKYRYYGKKCLLINSNTFSTALIFATVFKDYDMGIILGEPTSNEVNTFGDIYPFDLPNSKLWVWCSAKRYIRPSGEMTSGGLKPDLLVKDEDDRILKYAIDFIINQHIVRPSWQGLSLDE